MLKRIALLFSLTAGFTIGANAQKTCSSDDVYKNLVQKHPEMAIYEEQLENAIQQKISSGSLNQFARTTNGPDTTIYDIPIVIHVIHDYGAEFIPDTAILKAVNHWTKIDLGLNYEDTSDVIPPFKPYIGNPRIHLHLATIDPDGNPTRGIVRHHSYLTVNGGDESKLDDWPQDKYVNIWFVRTFGADNAGAAAYAYYPFSGASIPYYDGVISLYDYIDRDKTIPHELGHVFNLQHVWGNNNSPENGCGDDHVDDTPPTTGHLFDCNAKLYDTTCSLGYMKTYRYVGTNTDSVTVDYPDTANVQNIMDYSGCMVMFTKGQVARMRAALTNSTAGRNNLWSPANLQATGALAAYPDLPPVAEFSVERGVDPSGLTAEPAYFLCANSTTSFKFKNQSWNDTIDNVQWTLSNGATTPASTNMGIVQTKFMQPGWATVTLTANSNAGTDTVSTQAVYIADTVAIQPYGYTQNFYTENEFANWPMFNYYNNGFKWEWYNGAGYGDNNCVRYRSYDDRAFPLNQSGTPIGDHDDMYTPGFDISDTTGPVYLNFHTAGAVLSGASGARDTLEIWTSITCGLRWVKIAAIAGSNLDNAGVRPQEYSPAASDWKAQTVLVPRQYRTSKAFYRFRYRPAEHGNNLYFDDFSISGVSTEVREVMTNPEKFNVYPNPAHNGCNIAFFTGASGKVKLEISDLAGKTVYARDATYTGSKAIEEHISASELPLSGVYFITVRTDDKKMTQKLVIY